MTARDNATPSLLQLFVTILDNVGVMTTHEDEVMNTHDIPRRLMTTHDTVMTTPRTRLPRPPLGLGLGLGWVGWVGSVT